MQCWKQQIEPTHGHTEPWRFMVFMLPDKIEVFGNLHATLYQQITPY